LDVSVSPEIFDDEVSPLHELWHDHDTRLVSSKALAETGGNVVAPVLKAANQESTAPFLSPRPRLLIFEIVGVANGDVVAVVVDVAVGCVGIGNVVVGGVDGVVICCA
jgi:hypothetical protein